MAVDHLTDLPAILLPSSQLLGATRYRVFPNLTNHICELEMVTVREVYVNRTNLATYGLSSVSLISRKCPNNDNSDL